MMKIDYIALGIPDYPKIVKRPMDLGTIRKKVDAAEYDSAAAFEADVRLVIDNCKLYNAPGTPVHMMGLQLERLFEEKWSQQPFYGDLTYAESEPSEGGSPIFFSSYAATLVWMLTGERYKR
jgi:hypothetical protein